MKKRKGSDLSQSEIKLIEQLRQNPEMMVRVQSILDITRDEGDSRSADEVEEKLVEEMRRLGGATLQHWASKVEERVSSELQRQDTTVRSRKKKG